LAGSIPIYRGAPGINAFMPSPSSFVNANVLSPRQLADEIIRINASRSDYDAFFQFKQSPLPEEFYRISNMSYVHPNVVKRICETAKEIQSQSPAVKAAIDVANSNKAVPKMKETKNLV
jgi:hypothetical protein